MASIQFSRSDSTTVWATASNCATSHTYTIQVYSGGTWWDKVTNLYGNTSYTKSFSVNGSGSYSARLWDETIQGVAATGSIPEWETSKDVTVTIKNYLNSTTALVDGSYTGQVGTSFSITAPGTQYQTYANQYTFQYYTLSSENYSQNHSANEPIFIKDGLQVRVYYKSISYPYTTYVYVNGSLVRTAQNTTNTESRVRISELSAYTAYADAYDFQYAKVGDSSVEYASYSLINLTQGSMTYISLYFVEKLYPYTIYIYIDGEAGPTTTNTTNTESRVRISELSAYTAYADAYDFQYAKVGDSSVEYASYSLINLTQGSMTYISLYFVEKLYPYTIYIYIDGEAGPTTTNTTNTESSVLVSSLFADTQYAIDYDFQYATVVGLSGQYDANSYITLTSGSTTGIQLYFKSKIRSVEPIISSVTTTSTTATINWSKNGGTEGVWIIYYGLSSATMESGGYITSSPATITGLAPGKTYIFYIQNYVSSSDKANSNSVTAATNEAIGYFAWTNDDATNIQTGQPVTNLTASAWQNLIAKVAACGGNTGSIPTASSGTKITANHFNQMRNAISGLTGAGSVASSVTSGTSKVLASLFANATTALKEAINRAISAKNNQ